MRVRRLWAALVASVMLPAWTRAQAPRAISVDIALGPGTGNGGRLDYYNESGAAAELLVGVRRSVNQHRMWAVTAGTRGSIATTDPCYVRVPPSVDKSCRPAYPTVVHLGLLDHGRIAVSIVTPPHAAGGGAAICVTAPRP